MIWLPSFYIFCKVVLIISVILFLGSSLVSRSSMGQALWDGGSIQAPSKWWAGYTELHEVRGSKQIFFFVCLMHVSFVRYYQAACGRMWPGLVLQVARVCLCEWRKAPVCMWHKAPLCECEWHKAPMCVWERVTQSTCVYVAQSARVCEVCWGLYALSLAPFFFLFSEITRSWPACLWKWTVYVFLSFVYYTCHLRPSILFCSLTLLQQGQVLGLQGRYAPYT